jgi:hypothetical protein
MSGHEKEIFDLAKWHSQTIGSVQETLARADAPCAGYSLVFMDFIDKDTIVWKFKTYLAFDPNNPVSEEDRKKLERIFEGYARLAENIMNGTKVIH